MSRVWRIAVTEFVNTLLSKGFLVAVVLTPLIIAASVAVQNTLKERVDIADRRFAVVDGTGKLFAVLASAARSRDDSEIYETAAGVRRQTKPRYVPEAADVSSGADAAAVLSQRVRSGELFAFVLIEPDATSPDAESSGVAYHTQTPTFIELPRWIEDVLNREIRRLRLEADGVDYARIVRLTARAPMMQLGLASVDEGGRPVAAAATHLGATFGVPAAAMFLMFILVFMSVPMALHGILEEKQQRIWEVLVSSVSPFSLLLGKLLGTVLIAMLLSAFYVGGAVLFAREMGVAHAIPASLYAWFLLFLLLALLIYGSMFSAIGAAASEIRDAQSLMMPAMLLIIIPMLGWVAILHDPSSALARGLSLFPPATPMLMLLRIALPPGPAAWEIALSVVLTSAFTLACVWAAGKIFRVGILAQGQTPTFGRLLSWIMAK